MNEGTVTDRDFVRYLSRTTGLPDTTVHRLIQDVLNEYNEPVERFVQRRHRELQTNGTLRNNAIFSQIASEASGRLFQVPALSTRQIRRIIYG